MGNGYGNRIGVWEYGSEGGCMGVREYGRE